MENIILHVKYIGDGTSALDFAKEITSSGILTAIQNEPGCLCYKYYSSLENSNEILLTEIWADQDALDAHQKTENMTKLKAIRENYGVPASIEKFFVSRE